MSTTLSVHAESPGGFATIRTEVHDHQDEYGEGFTVTRLVLDDTEVSVFLHLTDLLDTAGALERAAQDLRNTAALYKMRRRARSIEQLRADLVPTVREYLAEVDAE